MRAPIPAGRDPFVNTQLISLGVDESGEERFWISSYNNVSGTVAVLVTESGQDRIFRFPPRFPGFYSAAARDAHTVWLCNQLSQVVRFDVDTQQWETFDTGAPEALVFQGMVYDDMTGKLFAAAFPPPDTTAFSFDTRTGRPAKVYPDVCAERYMCTSFANGDSTYSIAVYNPDVTLLRWDPGAETVTSVRLSDLVADSPGPVRHVDPVGQLVRDSDGRVYFPGWGWYDPITGTIAEGPRPDREATWFARIGPHAWGMHDGRVLRWHLPDGQVTDVCTINDTQFRNITLSRRGKLIAVSRYGDFYRYDAHTGALELSKRLATEGIGHVDCIRRIDDTRVLGTQFITQRFWQLDLAAGAGQDMGRAAGGDGEILQTWNIDGTIYQAAYVTGQLTAYDPDRPARYPENPRPVAEPPGGMRPVAAADDGRVLYYSCTHRYGLLGGLLVRYDTRTGEANYRDDPVPDHAIRSLHWNARHGKLVGGTTVDADCFTCAPAADRARAVVIDRAALEVTAGVDAPEGVGLLSVVGEIDDSSYLVTLAGRQWGVLDVEPLALHVRGSLDDFGTTRPILPGGRPGWFVVHAADRVEAWQVGPAQDGAPQRQAVLLRDSAVYRCFTDHRSVYAVTARELIVLDDWASRIEEEPR